MEQGGVKVKRNQKRLTTSELDRIVSEVINPGYKALLECGVNPEVRWNAVHRIHRCYKPSRRDECARVVMEEMETLIGRLARQVTVLRYSEGAARRRASRCSRLAGEAESLREELERWKAKAAEAERFREDAERRARAEKRRVQTSGRRELAGRWGVLNPLEERILEVMGRRGLGRPWRIEELLARKEHGGYSAGSVKNSLGRLLGKKLVKHLLVGGREARWSGPRGGGRYRLVVLSDFGEAWYEERFGVPPVESELLWAQRKHSGIVHGVMVLEAADCLEDRGYRVEREPEPIVRGEWRWGRRAEPDLMVLMDGDWWPVEVQREVADKPKYREKWSKALEAAGRLAIVLFTEEKLERQRWILARWSRQRGWPKGEVLLASLEEMARDCRRWEWKKMRT
jgi:hypothetical protein